MYAPRVKNINPEKRFDRVKRIFLPKKLQPTVFLKMKNFWVNLPLSRNALRINKGTTIPKTQARVQAPPKRNDAGKAASAKTPARTGAQHVVAIPENTPKTKTEPKPEFLSCGWTKTGNENCNPATRVNPRRSKKIDPKRKMALWYVLKT